MGSKTHFKHVLQKEKKSDSPKNNKVPSALCGIKKMLITKKIDMDIQCWL